MYSYSVLGRAQSIFDVLNVILNINYFWGYHIDLDLFRTMFDPLYPSKNPRCLCFFFRSLGNTAIESYAKDGRLEPPKPHLIQKMFGFQRTMGFIAMEQFCWEYLLLHFPLCRHHYRHLLPYKPYFTGLCLRRIAPPIFWRLKVCSVSIGT